MKITDKELQRLADGYPPTTGDPEEVIKHLAGSLVNLQAEIMNTNEQLMRNRETTIRTLSDLASLFPRSHQ
jgi:hypothetical protein